MPRRLIKTAFAEMGSADALINGINASSSPFKTNSRPTCPRARKPWRGSFKRHDQTVQSRIATFVTSGKKAPVFYCQSNTCSLKKSRHREMHQIERHSPLVVTPPPRRAPGRPLAKRACSSAGRFLQRTRLADAHPCPHPRALRSCLPRQGSDAPAARRFLFGGVLGAFDFCHFESCGENILVQAYSWCPCARTSCTRNS